MSTWDLSVAGCLLVVHVLRVEEFDACCRDRNEEMVISRA